MILEQLMEKKDLRIYLDTRIKQLERTWKTLVKETVVNEDGYSVAHENGVPKRKLTGKQKGALQQRFFGRIRELEQLKKLLDHGRIKNAAKLQFDTNRIHEDETTLEEIEIEA